MNKKERQLARIYMVQSIGLGYRLIGRVTGKIFVTFQYIDTQNEDVKEFIYLDSSNNSPRRVYL